MTLTAIYDDNVTRSGARPLRATLPALTGTPPQCAVPTRPRPGNAGRHPNPPDQRSRTPQTTSIARGGRLDFALPRQGAIGVFAGLDGPPRLGLSALTIQLYAPGMHSGTMHTANVLGAMVDALARDLEATTAASASGPGGRAAAVTALAGFASGSPIDRLAWSLGLSHSRAVRLVDQLEADGHVTRARGTVDRRAVLVTLTASGRALARKITTARLAILRDEVEALDASDRAALDRITATVLSRRIDSLRAAERVCRLCEPHACGHPRRCPVTRADGRVPLSERTRGSGRAMTAVTARMTARETRNRRLGLRQVAPVALIGLAALAPLAFSPGSGIVGDMIVAAVYVVMALGLNIVVGFAGLLDLGYVAFFAIGAYTAAYFASDFWRDAGHGQGLAFLVDGAAAQVPGIHLNFLLVFVLAVVATSVAGALIGVPTLRLRSDYIAVVTLAFGEIIGQIATKGRDIPLFGGTLTAGRLNIGPIDRIDLPFLEPFGALNLRPWYWFALALVALVLVVNVRLRDSRIGRAWIALRDDEDAAAAAGIPIARTKLRAYAIGAGIGGVAGAFYASYLSVVNADQFQFSFSIFVLSMVVVGGLGSIGGVVIGAIALSAVSTYLLPDVLYSVPSKIGLDFNFSQITSGVFGAIIVIVMLLRPEGLIPARRKRERFEV